MFIVEFDQTLNKGYLIFYFLVKFLSGEYHNIPHPNPTHPPKWLNNVYSGNGTD